MAKRQREKSDMIDKTRDKRPTAIARYIRIPSSKMEIVLDLIRGKGYNEAAAILANTNKSACPVILKVLNSAAANAENNLNIMKDNLFVAECWSMAGPTLKRMMPRARGRADRILKRTSHIRIILDERADTDGAKPKTKAKATAAKATATTKAATVQKADTKAGKSEKGETAMKTTTPTNAKQMNAKQGTALKAKEVPDTQSERPLTNKPNTKAPLGTKETKTATASKTATPKTAATAPTKAKTAAKAAPKK